MASQAFSKARYRCSDTWGLIFSLTYTLDTMALVSYFLKHYLEEYSWPIFTFTLFILLNSMENCI